MDNEPLITFDLGDGLRLRSFTDGDAEAVFEAVIANRDRLAEFMHWMTPEYSIDDARSFVARNREAASERNAFSLAIVRGERFIGSIGFVYFDEKVKKTEIGYWIDAREEGQGIISASCRQLINYAFGERQFNRIEIRCASSNVRSAAVPRRLGFKLEGLLRESEIRNDHLQDFFVFGLLRRDWPCPAEK